MTIRHAVVGLVFLALGAASCGASEPRSESTLPTIELEPSTAVLAASVDRTIDLGSYSFEMIVEVQAPGVGPISFTGTGSADSSAGTARIDMDLSSMFDSIGGDDAELALEMFGDGVFTVIVTPTTVYMRMAALAELIGGDTEWISMPIDAGALPTDGFTFGLGDPSSMFSDLSRAGDVEKAGREDVRGISTTRFVVPLDADLLNEVGAGDVFTSDVPLNVWIDDSGLIRRIEGSFAADGASGAVAMEFFDFGLPADINIPSSGDVTNFGLGDLFGA